MFPMTQETLAQASQICAGVKPTNERLREIIADESSPHEVRRMAQELVDARQALAVHDVLDKRDGITRASR
jgi:uncharacterized protein (UPF0147 family)